MEDLPKPPVNEMEESKQPPFDNTVPDWLDKLQNESWQAEILISGGAFFGLLNAYDVIESISVFLRYSTNVHYNLIMLIIAISGLAVFILTFGFLVHLILRGFWIGLVGLNYAFPSGINSNKLAFKGKFKDVFKEESNTSMIIALDKYCGIIFALTFVSLFTVLGFFIYLGVFFMLPVTLIPAPENAPQMVKWVMRAYIILVAVGSLLTVIDFISAGRLKKVRWLVPVYYPFYKVMSFVTLSVFYRRLYYTLVSNIRGYYILLFIGLVIGALFGLVSIFDDGATGLSAKIFSQNSGYHDDGAFLSIRSERVEESTLDVSLHHLVRLENLAFDKWSKSDSLKSKTVEFKKLDEGSQLKVINELYHVYVDGKRLSDSLGWFVSRIASDNSFMGMSKIRLSKTIDLSGLPNGLHELGVRINLDSASTGQFPINKNQKFHGRIKFILQRKANTY